MRSAWTALTGVVVATAVAGCGGGSDYANEPRPPTTINVTAAITDDKVTISPRDIGAGPVVIIIANETQKAHRVTVETDELGASSGGIKQQTGPINPQGTGTLKLDMKTGEYTVSVDGGAISDASLKVGKDRPSSQDQLLQP
jgi:N-acetylglucosamine kinase-like BadF-type ATPase